MLVIYTTQYNTIQHHDFQSIKERMMEEGVDHVYEEKERREIKECL